MSLSPRQQEIAALVARGMSDKEIAEHLGLAIQTVKLHLNHVKDRMKVHSRVEVAVVHICQKVSDAVTGRGLKGKTPQALRKELLAA